MDAKHEECTVGKKIPILKYKERCNNNKKEEYKHSRTFEYRLKTKMQTKEK